MVMAAMLLRAGWGHDRVDQDKLLKEAVDRFNVAIDYDWHNIQDGLDDLRFRAGEQWDQALKAERQADDRPCLTINRIPQFTRQVSGDARQNRPSIRVVPVDDEGDIEAADVRSGLIRDIEYQSNATNTYVLGIDSAVNCGIGHWRVWWEWADDDSFDQDIVIRPIRNAFSVVWDPNAKDPTRQDAMWCFVVQSMTHEAFKREFPEASTTNFNDIPQRSGINRWIQTDTVQVAEYYIKKKYKKRLARMQDGSTIDVTDMDNFAKSFLPIVEEVDRDAYKVQRYLLNGVEVLEGPIDLPTKYIPIVTCLGEEVYIEDQCYRHGIVRYAKDAQRMYNYWRSAQMEAVQLQPKAPYIATMDQIKEFLPIWQAANKENYPFLPYKADPKAPPPQRQSPPVSSQGMGQEILMAAEDMKSTTGIYDAALGAKSNETSGKAILARQQESDTGTFVYMDNLALAIRHTGRILLDLIPKFYTEERVVRLLNEDGSEGWQAINKTVVLNGEEYVINDLSAGRYDIRIETGPSYATKRQEAAESMVQFAQAVPNAAALIGDLIAQSMDWPKADAIAERLRKALPPGFAEDEEGQQQEQAPPQPDPAQVADAMKAEADAAKAQADIQKTQAETEGKRLDNAMKAAELAASEGQLEGLIEQVVQQVLVNMA